MRPIDVGVQRRRQPSTVGGEAHGEIVEVKRLGKQHVLDRGRILPGRRSRIGARSQQEEIVVLFEFIRRRPEVSDEGGALVGCRRLRRARKEDDALRQRLLRGDEFPKRPVALLFRHQLLQEQEGCHSHGGYDEQGHPIGTFDEKHQPV